MLSTLVLHVVYMGCSFRIVLKVVLGVQYISFLL